jgi:cytochrome c biogenesis protein CcmG/thiol:disulfide interchange protein DsbE
MHQPPWRPRPRALVAALALLAAGCGSVSTGPTTRSSPGQAPAFTLKGLDGRQHSLSDYRGKVVMINFWATWCIPCRAEMPDIEHEYRAHRDQGLVVLGIDPKEGQDVVSRFVQDIGVSYTILLDPKGEVYDRYGVSALPQTLIVDRGGAVVKERTGQASRAQMEQELSAALAGR